MHVRQELPWSWVGVGAVVVGLLTGVAQAGLAASAWQPEPAVQPSALTIVTSKDGTRIAVECAGRGPTLLFVHGGVGDRTRWTPMFPLLSSTFTTCAMDRRGRGASGDAPRYHEWS